VLKRIPIRFKLILLAGVPVIAALILAAIVARDARRQAESAAALGSIEDLAHVAARMGRLVHALQLERSEVALRLGQKTTDLPALKARFADTDAAARQLRAFLAVRKVAELPARLVRDLNAAEQQLSVLNAERAAARARGRRIDQVLLHYKNTNLALISATAALSQLTDDGQLMRAISALVLVLQIKERASQEHALLGHVFAINEFPPGTFKDLVTLTTEEADYVSMLKVAATDNVSRQYQALSQDAEFARAAQLRQLALDAVDDDFHVDAEEWSSVQGKKIERLRSLEVGLNDAVLRAAVDKIRVAERSVRLSYALGGGVIALSAALAALIARGISRSVVSLASAAEQVSKQKNFAIRALKTSDDELGRLTTTFNEMLAGIQARDAELRHHGENLEQLVQQRTAALQARNRAMRLVLDNVEQGLVTVGLDGKMSSERSRAFDDWFGGDATRPFAEHLSGSDQLLRDCLTVGWQQVTDGVLPTDCALDQMPRRIRVGGRHYSLSYKAIAESDTLQGALIVVSDVTLAMQRIRRDAEQREQIHIFERIMRDRVGFMEFTNECEALVRDIVERRSGNKQLVKRALHTLKGSCSVFGVESIAAIAHRLEGEMADTGELPSDEKTSELSDAWAAFAARVRQLSPAQAEPVAEVTHDELRELEAAAQARAPHTKLIALLQRLKYERGAVRLRRVAEQAQSLAQRLGRGELEIEIVASPDVRFRPERWAPFWSAFVHVVRNALDHGIEPPDARAALGKPAKGKLRLVAEAGDAALTIAISDDGRGIDWAKVRDKAQQRGLPDQTEQQLVEALFSDGLSTAETVTDISGRGVGLSAVREVAASLGGDVTVMASPGAGTTLSFRFPTAAAARANETLPPAARMAVNQ
jgi:two-component system, chemotaxis family, sensor kinase CheA